MYRMTRSGFAPGTSIHVAVQAPMSTRVVVTSAAECPNSQSTRAAQRREPATSTLPSRARRKRRNALIVHFVSRLNIIVCYPLDPYGGRHHLTLGRQTDVTPLAGGRLTAAHNTRQSYFRRSRTAKVWLSHGKDDTAARSDVLSFGDEGESEARRCADPARGPDEFQKRLCRQARSGVSQGCSPLAL